MPGFIRHKSLSQRFQRVILNENDLARLGEIVNTLSERFGDVIEIKIVSADREETVRTSDPGFFVSQHMPPQIYSVSITYNNYKAPVSCRVDFVASSDGHATLSVDGTERETVSGIYHELERELGSRVATGASLVQKLNSLPVTFVLNIIIGVAIYSIFDLALDFASAKIPGFDGSEIHRLFQNIGLISMVLGVIAGGLWVSDLLKRSFPPVEFSGRLSDANTINRSRLIWVSGAILLPIVVNVFSNLLTNVFK